MNDEIKKAYSDLRKLLRFAPLPPSSAQVQALNRLDESEMWIEKAYREDLDPFGYRETGTDSGGSRSQ